MDIIVGTSNKGKVREIAAILSPLGYNLQPQSFDIDEYGSTIEENAVIKALAYSEKNPNMFVIAEDSGLVVPKLNGLPGAFSSRFHSVKINNNYEVISVPKETYTTDKTEIDKMNNDLLLSLISEIPFEERAAYFEVSFVVAKDGKVLYQTSSKSYGYISDELKGNNGFGYDPLFIGNDSFGKTYAELDTARKNLRSHRKKALKELGFWVAQNIDIE